MTRTRPTTAAIAAARLPAVLLLCAALAWPAAAQTAAQGGIAEAGAYLTFGIAAFHRGDYDEAAGHFERAAAADPESGDAHHWLGLTYLALGRTAEAESALEAALAAGEPPRAGRDRVRADLERARGAGDALVVAAPGLGEARPFGDIPLWEVRLSAAAANDDNPLRLTEDSFLFYQLPDGTLLTGPESDTLLRAAARLEVRPLVDRNGWTLTLGGTVDDARYNDFDFLNVRTLAASAQLAWGGDPAGYLAGPLGAARVPLRRRPLALLFQVRWQDASIDGDGFRTSLEVAGSATVNEGRAMATRLSAGWSDHDYDVDQSGTFERSGGEVSAAADQVFYLGRRDRFVSLGVESSQRDAGPAFDASALELRGALALPFGNRGSLQLGVSRQDVEYDDLTSNPLFGFFLADRARQDTIDRVSAALTWAATPRLLLTVGGSRTSRDTELGPAVDALLDLDYDRTVVTAGVSWYLMGGGGR